MIWTVVARMSSPRLRWWLVLSTAVPISHAPQQDSPWTPSSDSPRLGLRQAVRFDGKDCSTGTSSSFSFDFGYIDPSVIAHKPFITFRTTSPGLFYRHFLRGRSLQRSLQNRMAFYRHGYRDSKLRIMAWWGYQCIWRKFSTLRKPGRPFRSHLPPVSIAALERTAQSFRCTLTAELNHGAV